MAKILNIRYGQYIFYELLNSAGPIDSAFDSHVKLVEKYDSRIERAFGVPHKVMEELLSNNDRCFVYFENNLPLGMMWGHQGCCYIRGPGIPIIQENNSIYWYWIYTLPESRGKNIYKKLRDSFFNYYRGSAKFSAIVEKNNIIMHKEMNKIGFVDMKHICYFKLGSASLLYERCSKNNAKTIRLEIGNRLTLPVI